MYAERALRAGATNGSAAPSVLTLASDERLTVEMRQGSEAAFEVVYGRYARSLLAMCRQLLGSRDDAEEAVQQSLASAWAYLQRDDRAAPGRLKPWLFAIARNHCRTVLRVQGTQDVALDEGDAHLAPRAIADLPAVVDPVEQRAELRALLADVDDLPPDQRYALVLSELQGLSHANIAAVLGRREAGIKSLVHQARMTLVDWRDARNASCAEIRERLSAPRRGSLHRRDVRRHLQLCDSCSAFQAKLRSQSRPPQFSLLS
jgi:RNA polymerase sigma factor (sigma-70 family)